VRGVRLVGRLGEPSRGSLSGLLELETDGVEPAELEALGRELGQLMRARGVDARGELRQAALGWQVRFELDGLARALGGGSVRLGPVEVQ
jgi:hypothetical protein